MHASGEQVVTQLQPIIFQFEYCELNWTRISVMVKFIAKFWPAYLPHMNAVHDLGLCDESSRPRLPHFHHHNLHRHEEEHHIPP
jgi:hypothetical protein